MNRKIKLFFTAVIVAGQWLFAPGISDAQITLGFSISGTVLTQGPTDNDGEQMPPTKNSITTASILKQLALDENAAGFWPSNKFPAGAKLTYVAFGTGFQVVDREGDQLLVVTNILTYNIGSNSISYGSWNEQLVTLAYDATPLGGTNKYSVTGLGTTTTSTESFPASAQDVAEGYFPSIQTDTFSLQNGTGQGVNAEGVGIILTGVTITEIGRLANGGPPVGGFSEGGNGPPPPDMPLP